MERHGDVVQLDPDKVDEYVRLHREVWPEIQAMIEECNIRNYSIFMRRLPDGHDYLFSYWEYCGIDFSADMAKMAADPATQKWWDVCKPCHVPLADRQEGEWWASMKEVYHQD